MIVIACDVTSEESLKNMRGWLGLCGRHCKDSTKILIVATKTDDIDRRVVSTEDLVALCNKTNVSFIETSSLKSENIEHLFMTVASLSSRVSSEVR